MDKKNVFIMDIDGTLANGEHRQHHVRGPRKNWAAYNELMHLDARIEPMHVVYTSLISALNKVIFVSGREGSFVNEAATREWLCNNKFNQHYVDQAFQAGYVDYHDAEKIELYMRAEKDYRPDDIVKEEIYRTHIEPKYNVIGVFDDRPRVVRKWKEMGLFVFNVYQDPDHTEF